MSDAAEGFARLTGELEDLHGLAIEGQASDQPREVLHSLARALATGLLEAARTLAEARLVIGDD